MNKKRILVLTPIYYPHYGGAEKAIYELYKKVSDEFEIDLLCPNFNSKKIKENNGYFNIYRVCNEVKNKYLKTLIYQYYFIKKAILLSKKKNYDLIHSHYILPTGIAGLILKKKLKIPFLITEHHFGTGMDISSEKENPFYLNIIMKYIASKSDLIISTGKTQNTFLNFLNFKNFKTVELGGDCEVSKESILKLKRELKVPKNKKILFSISRLVYRKRYDILINSLFLLKKLRSDFILFIGGKGPEINNLKRLVSNLNLDNEIVFLGFMEDELVSKYRRIADAFVTSSEFEGAGIIYFEAFASNLPIFAKNNVASSDAITHLENGVLFKEANDLSILLNKYLWDPVFLLKISKEGFKLYKNKNNWNEYANNYKKIYSKYITY